MSIHKSNFEKSARDSAYRMPGADRDGMGDGYAPDAIQAAKLMIAIIKNPTAEPDDDQRGPNSKGNGLHSNYGLNLHAHMSGMTLREKVATLMVHIKQHPSLSELDPSDSKRHEDPESANFGDPLWKGALGVEDGINGMVKIITDADKSMRSSLAETLSHLEEKNAPAHLKAPIRSARQAINEFTGDEITASEVKIAMAKDESSLYEMIAENMRIVPLPIEVSSDLTAENHYS